MATEKKLKVYVENASNIADFFTISPQVVESVAKQFPQARSGIDVQYGVDGKGFDEGVRSADILIAWQFPTSDLAKRAPNLRWIYTFGAGVDHLLPLSWLPANVTLTNASGAHRPKVDEFMMASILMLNNRFAEMMTNQRNKRWEMRHSRIVKGKTLLMLGVGATGGAAAEVGKMLGMRTIGVRPGRQPHPFIDEMHGPEDLQKVLSRADFVVVTVPKTSEKPYLGRRDLEHCKPGAYLINLSRAAVVDYAALTEMLKKGHIAGAVCDLEDPQEVNWDQNLWDVPNLFIVPHCGTNDPDVYAPNSVRIFFENLERYLAGKPLDNVIDRNLGY